MQSISVLGIGPGSTTDLTFRARESLEEAQVVLGYQSYIQRVTSFIMGKKVFPFGMGEEIFRCQETIRWARKGFRVALLSGGDPGIYGMAGLLLEIALEEGISSAVEVIPGVSAMNAASALLGAPLGGDFAVVSLSDYLLPWEQIAERLSLIAQADLVVVLYNPGSSLRLHSFQKAVAILKKYRDFKTPVGIVRNASLPDQWAVLTTLEEAEKHPVDMRTIVLVGNRETFIRSSFMITPRGYRL